MACVLMKIFIFLGVVQMRLMSNKNYIIEIKCQETCKDYNDIDDWYKEKGKKFL